MGLSAETFRIRTDLDVFDARRGARTFAASVGFSRTVREELVIVVSELASNILKYGISGDIGLSTIEHERLGVGLHIIARDIGPPFSNLQMALIDGHESSGPVDPAKLFGRRGIGAGLGAVIRFTDSFACEPEEVGKQIRVTRYLHRPTLRTVG